MSGGGCVENLVEYLVARVDGASAVEQPFYHITFTEIFPAELYRQFIDLMPVAADYRPISGRSKGNDLADGTATRVKIDLFPEYLRFLPADKRKVWSIVGRALSAGALQDAFVRRLAPGLERRFGHRFADTNFFPIPVLTRDTPGYHIAPHTDTHWKGITVLLFMPRDASMTHVGTVIHERGANGELRRVAKVEFTPNSGFAFAVGDNTWHSVDPVGPEIATRDLIILQYFVDSGLSRFLRNRGKRVGNFLLNEVRHLVA